MGFIKTVHGEILYQKAITFDRVKGIEFECRGRKDNATYYIYYRSFYFVKKLISQGIWIRHQVPRNDERLNSFFSTFNFTGKAKHNSPWSDKTLVIKGVEYAFIII